MYATAKYYFFRCTSCGAWYYTKKRLKTKKCIKCNKTFQFKQSAKFSKVCNRIDAIAYIQALKKKDVEEKSIRVQKYRQLSL